MRFMLLIYHILFPIGFLLFLPGLLYKLWRRPGWKTTFAERFGHFSPERRARLASGRGAIWLHSVSVGETVIALALLKHYQATYPDHKFVLSTTTTTGQALARSKAPEGVEVIFCPIDFFPFVRRTMTLVQPSLLVILETEIWPALIYEAKRVGCSLALVNARMSDRSSRGYYRFRKFFRPLLEEFDLIATQSEADAERFRHVSPAAAVVPVGNLKFDQPVPADLQPVDLNRYFGPGPHLILLGASTHPGEEELIASVFRNLQPAFPPLRLVLVPRHAERGSEIAAMLQKQSLKFARRSREAAAAEPVDCLLADTTGEMLKLMAAADVVVMGKSLAGQDEGHNLIEPALLAKPIVTGSVLRNFRFILQILTEADAVRLVENDDRLQPVLTQLFADAAQRRQLGERAYAAVARHAGATAKVIKLLEETL
ncbi:3-deoxy-D-manno-octulosonic acid transferase [Victivallis sp. Marseille-Q1083]|uniref:3-deoxy-D-manno-octulosonic acid transferase n=1 Tax=Victivallis sp. Marseille-Q1083 TaxID=2717288 RepID=UPI00158C048B|nr:3-deoxy-D-manno-octulosonic acid transferase [Victivallis sp. Marseille-Q1083]